MVVLIFQFLRWTIGFIKPLGSAGGCLTLMAFKEKPTLIGIGWVTCLFIRYARGKDNPHCERSGIDMCLSY
jgi:hypothetical protein